MNRLAIIDLGTNTFNLLITESHNKKDFEVLCSIKTPVKLGEGRINEGEIIPAAMERGINAIKHYASQLKEYRVSKIKAFGTSALRTASNGHKLLDLIKDKTGIEVEIVSGEREAELIYLGVKQTLAFKNQKFLILDIGGGSNEFIVGDMHNIYWKKSYPLGIARQLTMFNPSDPLTQEEKENIENYMQKELSDLFKIIEEHNIEILVGASGSFETFIHMVNHEDVVETEGETEAISRKVEFDQFTALYEKLIHSTLEERKNMKGLEPMRLEMIVLAILFVKILLDRHNFKELYQSNFALKEGAIMELLNQ